MDRIIIRGGRPLDGRVTISGAKNAALPLMAASLLTAEELTLANVPALADIATLTRLLRHHGVEVHGQGDNFALSARDITETTAPYDLVRKMRASVLVLGPLLARKGEAKVSLPGGCAIGTRPIDLHLSGLERLGADIRLDDGYVVARAPHGLRGAAIRFPKVSVGATENILMAAVLAAGETVLDNAAREPEVGDLADCLVAMGARISGIGTERLVIQGVDGLHGASHVVIPDRIECGTYAMAAAITGGELELAGARHEVMGAATLALERSGATVEQLPDGIRVSRKTGAIRSVDVETRPYPGLATDLQAQFMALMTLGDGIATITETIFENRFMHVPELARMGADITVRGGTARVLGVRRLKGAAVMATDLRASVCLVLAALAAEGETSINRVYHLDRGYQALEQKLAACGADIERVKAG